MSKTNWIIELQCKKKLKVGTCYNARCDAIESEKKNRHNAQIKLGDDWIKSQLRKKAHFKLTDQFPLFGPMLEFISQLAHLFGLFGPSCNVNKNWSWLNMATGQSASKPQASQKS